MKYEYIEESEMEVVKRGRKSEVPTEVVEAIKGMPVGKVVRFTDLTLDPSSETYKNDKASLSSMIRQAGRLAGVEVRINFTPNGVPQVSTAKPSKKAKPTKK